MPGGPHTRVRNAEGRHVLAEQQPVDAAVRVVPEALGVLQPRGAARAHHPIGQAARAGVREGGGRGRPGAGHGVALQRDPVGGGHGLRRGLRGPAGGALVAARRRGQGLDGDGEPAGRAGAQCRAPDRNAHLLQTGGQGVGRGGRAPGRGCVRGGGGGSEEAPEAVRRAVGGGCRSGWGRLLSVPNAIEAGTCRQGDSGWAQAGRPGRARAEPLSPPFQCIPGPRTPPPGADTAPGHGTAPCGATPDIAGGHRGFTSSWATYPRGTAEPRGQHVGHTIAREQPRMAA